MLTQQDLLDRLNQLTLRYNLTWRDIKYDADKAIDKINNFMGTLYPKLSTKMVSPTSTYTMRVGSLDVEIFPEQYMHSVVIPFIAMEILARDEEFTTIYNKYLAELDEGLFNMFSNEFNRVPLALRQQPDQGVFFASDSALAAVERNLIADLPIYKFRMIYHINNTAIVLYEGETFTEDTQAYVYNAIATLMAGPTAELLSYDGTTAYTFKGWMRNPLSVTIMGDDSDVIDMATEFTMTSDVHLYAKWDVTSTLDITALGEVSIKDAYAPSLTNLIIPDIVAGVMVRKIKTNFTALAINLVSITLPKWLTEVAASAFVDFLGTSIVFPETPLSVNYAGITIGTLAFDDTPNLINIVLPANITTIAADAFPVTTKAGPMYIKCRVLLQNKPVGWASGWYAATAAPYIVYVEWGYNA